MPAIETSLCGQQARTPYPLCCECPPPAEIGLGLLVAGQENYCPKLLTGRYPSIPVASNGEVELKDGSALKPIVLSELQIRHGDDNFSLVEMQADGTLAAFKGPTGDLHYAIWDIAGEMHLIQGDLVMNLADLNACCADLTARVLALETP